MVILNFVVHLAAAVMLLLYAVRMVRTGIERAFGASFYQLITAKHNPFHAAVAGLLLAVMLQSSAAVALLVAGFAASGALVFASGLAIILGADLGSALVIQIFFFNLDPLVPVLLAVGGWFFVGTERRKIRQWGRILLGIAFILISLRFLRETMDPIRESAFLPAIAGYLASDYITAFLIGASLAFIMHSSVAAILMYVTLVNINAIPLAAGVSLVLGANLGSAFVPMWLTRNMEARARAIVLTNLLLRSSGAVAVLFLINSFPILPFLEANTPGQTLINVQLAFNAALLLFLPFCGHLEKPIQALFAQVPPSNEEINNALQPVSALDNSVVDTPPLALASLKRETLRMGHMVEVMAKPLMELYETGDKASLKSITTHDKQARQALAGIRQYVAAMPMQQMSKSEAGQALELAEYAINLHTGSDIIVKRLLPLIKEKSRKQISFSQEDQTELANMHARVMGNMTLAFNVLLSNDAESAYLLLEEKSEATLVERSSRKKHLSKLAGREVNKFEASDIQLETLRALRDLNSQIAAIAYPILQRHGQLLDTE